jgi:peptidoglycan/xylan/chitin deacetylase (PgdA/CDA1 family)
MLRRIKKYYIPLVLTSVFLLLGISITKDLIDIYAVSSQRPTIIVPIMMYHQVKYTSLGKDVISPYEFESDLKYLSENNYHTITMTQLIDYVYDGEKLPENPIILSFDDGYISTYQTVFPLLQKYDMKIVLSIVGKGTDDFSKVDNTKLKNAHLTWNQVNEMVESGLVEVQNHTYDLHKTQNGRYGCSQMANETLANYERILMEDTIKLQERIKTMTYHTPNTFTYPYGKYNNNTDYILKSIGFKASLSCTYGVNLIRENDTEKLFGLKRICRSHNQGIKKLIKEGMETLRFINE